MIVFITLSIIISVSSTWWCRALSQPSELIMWPAYLVVSYLLSLCTNLDGRDLSWLPQAVFQLLSGYLLK